MTTKRLILGLFLLSAVSPQAAQAGDRFGLIDTTVILFCDKAAEVEIGGRRTTTAGAVRRYHVRLEPGRHSIVVRQAEGADGKNSQYRVGWLHVGIPGCACGCNGQGQRSHRFVWDKLDAWKSDVVASQIKQLRSDVDELKRQLKNLTTSKQQGPQTLLAYNGEPISQIPGDTLTKQIRKSNQFSLEVAFKTGEANQSGPARLVTLSKGVKNRNFTLGHEGHNLIFRLRTQNSDSNGMLKSGEFPLAKVELGELTHIIVSYDTKELKCYINGAKVKLNANGFSGSLAKWDLGNSLVLKDEKAGKRKWDGEISRVRIFDVAFGANQAEANYNRFLEDLEDNF